MRPIPPEFVTGAAVATRAERLGDEHREQGLNFECGFGSPIPLDLLVSPVWPKRTAGQDVTLLATGDTQPPLNLRCLSAGVRQAFPSCMGSSRARGGDGEGTDSGTEVLS